MNSLNRVHFVYRESKMKSALLYEEIGCQQVQNESHLKLNHLFVGYLEAYGVLNVCLSKTG